MACNTSISDMRSPFRCQFSGVSGQVLIPAY
jgi:hypothetical protein